MRKKRLKKFLAIITAGVMVLSLFSGIPFSNTKKWFGSKEVLADTTYTATYNIADGNVTINSGGNYKIIGDGNQVSNSIEINTLSEVTVTLENVNIKMRYEGENAFISGSRTNLILNGTNILDSSDANQASAVNVEGNKSLTISGSGTLDVYGGFWGAGIGGNYNKSCGTIKIDGGTINATATMGAAIGSGGDGSGAIVIINDGTVNAKSSMNGAAIGGGFQGSFDRVEINGSILTAISATGAAIGSGALGNDNNGKEHGKIVINGGTLNASINNSAAAAIGGGIGAVTPVISIYGGDITATSYQQAAGIGSGSDGGDIDISIFGGKINASCCVSGGMNIGGAGIGSGAKNAILTKGNINIFGGDITTIGGNYAAGIGNGHSNVGININIYGGDMKATGGNGGAGIGSGIYAPEEADNAINNINIYGGNIAATGGSEAAGIGAANNINIINGTIEAIGGSKAAGIGGNNGNNISIGSSNKNINISGGVIKAFGGDGDESGAGIGGGYNGNGGNIKISNGTIYAIGGLKAAGIGGGCFGSGANLVIDGGSINSNIKGNSELPTIGAGSFNNNAGTIKNSAGAELQLVISTMVPGNNVFLANADYKYSGSGYGNGDTNLYFYLANSTILSLDTTVVLNNVIGNVNLSVKSLKYGDTIISPDDCSIKEDGIPISTLWNVYDSKGNMCIGDKAKAGEKYIYQAVYTAPLGYIFGSSLENGNRHVANNGNTLIYTFDPIICAKVDPPISIPNLDSITYNTTTKLSDIVLPASFTWIDETIIPTPGNTGYMATYIPDDTYNYNNVDVNIGLIVLKADSILKIGCEDTISGIDLSPYIIENMSNEEVTYKYYSDYECKNEINTTNTAGVYYIKGFTKETSYYKAAESNILETNVIAANSYNQNDFQNIQKFLDQPSSVDGKTNGQQINANYSPNNPFTWSGIEWNNDSVKGIVGIGQMGEWDEKGLLGKLDCSNMDGLTLIDIWKNDIKSIELNGTFNLTVLDCGANDLTELNVNSNIQLETLYCDDNKLTSLDVSKLSQLKELVCSHNNFNTLDLSMNKELEAVECTNNAITTLNIKGADKLNVIDCSYNQISSFELNVSNPVYYTAIYNNPLIKCSVKTSDLDVDLKSDGFGYLDFEYGEGILKFGTHNDSGVTFNGWKSGSDIVSKDNPYYISSQSGGTYNLTADFSECAIHYYDWDGALINATLSLKNTKIAAIDNPIRPGYVFNGWYMDKDLTTEWNFNSDVLNDNVNLYSKYTALNDSYSPIAMNDPTTGSEYATILLSDLSLLKEDGTIIFEFKGETTRMPVSVAKNLFGENSDYRLVLHLKRNTQSSIESKLKENNLQNICEYELSLLKTLGNQSDQIHNFNGSLQLSLVLPDKLPSGILPSDLEVYYYNSETGVLESMKASYDSATNSLLFVTTHFSTFIVGAKITSNSSGGNINDNANPSGDALPDSTSKDNLVNNAGTAVSGADTTINNAGITDNNSDTTANGGVTAVNSEDTTVNSGATAVITGDNTNIWPLIIIFITMLSALCHFKFKAGKLKQ